MMKSAMSLMARNIRDATLQSVVTESKITIIREARLKSDKSGKLKAGYGG